METLVKHTSETYDVVEYSDCNKIDNDYIFRVVGNVKKMVIGVILVPAI